MKNGEIFFILTTTLAEAVNKTMEKYANSL